MMSVTLFLPLEVHRQLRIIAAETDSTLQAILDQAVGEWLERRARVPT